MNTAQKLLEMAFVHLSEKGGFITDALYHCADGFCKDEPLSDAFVRLAKATKQLTCDKRMTFCDYEDDERPLGPLFKMAIELEPENA